MEMMDMAADDTREELRRKLRSNFDGRIVRLPVQQTLLPCCRSWWVVLI